MPYYFRNITNCIDKRYTFIDCIMSTYLYKRCKVINSVSDGTKTFWQYIFFSTNHLGTHAICSIINKIYSNKRMAPNNKCKFLTPLKFIYTSNYSLMLLVSYIGLNSKRVRVHTKGLVNLLKIRSIYSLKGKETMELTWRWGAYKRAGSAPHNARVSTGFVGSPAVTQTQ